MAINRIAGTTKVNKGGGGIGSLLGKVIGGIAGTFVGQPMAGAAVGGAIGGGIGSTVNKPKQTQMGIGEQTLPQDPINKPSSAIDRLNQVFDIGSTVYGMTGSSPTNVPKGGGGTMVPSANSRVMGALQRRGY